MVNGLSHVDEFLFLFFLLNSACNPFTYTFRIRQCRRSLKVLFCKWQETVDVSPRCSQVVNTAQNAIVLRRISRMCYTTGEFVEEFREKNMPDYFGLGFDNLGQDDTRCEVFETIVEESKQQLEIWKRVARRMTLVPSPINRIKKIHYKDLVYDTKL